MKRNFKYGILLFAIFFVTDSHAQLLPRLGGQRAGISALTFLKIDPSPRSAALASSNLTLSGDGFSTYVNPAAISELDDLTIAASNTFWVAGINFAYASASKKFGNIGHFGLSATSLTTGKMERRTEFQPEGTGEYFYASYTAIGLSYSKKLTDMFSFGGTLKYVNETLAEFTAHTGVLDLGFLYTTDFKDLKFAVMLQSFGTNSKLKGDYDPVGFVPRDVATEGYPSPTIFKLAVSMVPYKTEDKSLFVAVQLNHPNDNAENIRIGTEFEYKQLLFLRAGYKINVKDQNYPTFGMGVRMRIGKHPLMFDYAADPTRYLGMIHRIGLTFALNRSGREEVAE